MTTCPSSRYVATARSPTAGKRQKLMLPLVGSQTRGLEALGRKVTSTASHLIVPNAEAAAGHYQTAMAQVHRQLRRPAVQRSVFSMARTTPTDMVRAKLSTTEIQHRALARLPDELLSNIPDHDNSYSLFQGFQASFPSLTVEGRKHRRRVSRGRKLLDDDAAAGGRVKSLNQLKRDRAAMMHEFELLGIRKTMSSSEIRDIDNKIANLHGMRRIILDRLAGLEQEEALLEHDSTLSRHERVLRRVMCANCTQSWMPRHG